MKKKNLIKNNIIIFIILIITVVLNLKLYNFKFSECYEYCVEYSKPMLSCISGYSLNRFAYESITLHILLAIIFAIIYLLLLFISIKLIIKSKKDKSAKKIPTVILSIINIILIITASTTIFYKDIKYNNKPQVDLPINNNYGTFTEVIQCDKGD